MLPRYFSEQGLVCAARLPATSAPSIRSAKLVHLLTNTDSGCDKNSGGSREGPCPEKLGQTSPSVIAEEWTGIHAHHLAFS